MAIRKLNGVTLMELMVVFILAIIIFGIMLTTNYYFQIQKAMDTKKKEDMASIQRIAEEYYADNHVYPPVSEMTYVTMTDTPTAGRVCGSKFIGSGIAPYTRELPCSPDSPTNDYVYFLTNGGQDYAVFVILKNKNDPTLKTSACNMGCSYYLDQQYPASSISENFFNYDVTSPSLTLPACQPTQYIGCYPGTTTYCRGCPNMNCGGYARIYCQANWCLQYCNQ